MFQLWIPCLVKYLKKFLDGKEHVSGLFLDLTKAFFAVSHSLILSKIERLGLRSKSFSWVSSYVTRQDFACCWKIRLYSYVAWQGFSLTKQRMPPVYKKNNAPFWGRCFLFINDFPTSVAARAQYAHFCRSYESCIFPQKDSFFGDWNVCIMSGYLQWLLDNMLSTNNQKLYFWNFS